MVLLAEYKHDDIESSENNRVENFLALQAIKGFCFGSGPVIVFVETIVTINSDLISRWRETFKLNTVDLMNCILKDSFHRFLFIKLGPDQAPKLIIPQGPTSKT